MEASEEDSGRWSDMWCLLKTAYANGYYGAWPGWEVSISVLPLTLPMNIQD